MTPPWYALAAKALVAGATAVAVAGTVIISAAADDHFTTSELVAIVVALAGALAGPGLVYATRNAQRPLDPPADTVLRPLGDDDDKRRPDWWTAPQ